MSAEHNAINQEIPHVKFMGNSGLKYHYFRSSQLNEALIIAKPSNDQSILAIEHWTEEEHNSRYEVPSLQQLQKHMGIIGIALLNEPETNEDTPQEHEKEMRNMQRIAIKNCIQPIVMDFVLNSLKKYESQAKDITVSLLQPGTGVRPEN